MVILQRIIQGVRCNHFLVVAIPKNLAIKKLGIYIATFSLHSSLFCDCKSKFHDGICKTKFHSGVDFTFANEDLGKIATSN